MQACININRRILRQLDSLSYEKRRYFFGCSSYMFRSERVTAVIRLYAPCLVTRTQYFIDHGLHGFYGFLDKNIKNSMKEKMAF